MKRYSIWANPTLPVELFPLKYGAEFCNLCIVTYSEISADVPCACTVCE